MDREPSLRRVGEQKLQNVNESIDYFLSRREFVAGAIGTITTLTMQGITAIEMKNRTSTENIVDPSELEAVRSGDACAVSTDCQLDNTVVAPRAGEAVIADVAPTSTTTSSTTTEPPAPPETAPPPPPPEKKTLETVRRPFEFLLENEEQIFANYPYLAKLSESFGGNSPNLYGNIDKQLEHIATLDQAVQLSVDEFREFHIDKSQSETSFPDKGLITVRAILFHWTGHIVDVETLKNGLNLKGYGIQAYAHHDGAAFKLTPSYSHYQDHALGLSTFTAGIEIFSIDDKGSNIPLLSLTPAAIKSALYIAADMLEELKLPASRTTLLGHHFLDTVLINQYYDALSGTFQHFEGYKPPTIRKHDVVQDLIDVFVKKLQQLQSELHAA